MSASLTTKKNAESTYVEMGAVEFNITAMSSAVPRTVGPVLFDMWSGDVRIGTVIDSALARALGMALIVRADQSDTFARGRS